VAILPQDQSTLGVFETGRLPFADALELQSAAVAARSRGDIGDTLIVTEHDPVVTAGRATLPDELEQAACLSAFGLKVVPVSRGGRMTYHGPGQLVGYPIVDLRARNLGLHEYVETLEEALVDALTQLGLDARSRAGLRGVWIGDRKTASIGVAVRRWISYHGFAINVDCDLEVFSAFVPCGIQGVQMTTLERELGAPVDRNQLQYLVVEALRTRLGYDTVCSVPRGAITTGA
jgi:lipoate-protein ligase B